MSQQHQLRHQEFSIDQSQRKKIVRQDRFYPQSDTHFLKIENKTFPVENYAAFGVAIKGLNLDFAKNETYQGTYIVNGIEISTLDLHVVRKNEEDKVAFTILGQPLSIEAVKAVEKSREVIKSIVDFETQYKNVPTAFKHLTYEMRALLQNLESKVNQIETNSFELNSRDLSFYEEAVVQTITPFIEDLLPQISAKLTAALTGLNSDEVKLCYDFLRKVTGEHFYSSAYGHRAYHKPRGYAGDYEMMNNVYMNDLRGKSLFAKCMQRLFTDSAAGKAVRNRAEFILEKILKASKEKSNIRILSVASGPAKEIQELFLKYPGLQSNVEIHLLDQDEEALKYAQREILEICRNNSILYPQVHFHNLAIKNVINEGLDLGKFDIIYSAGLFDYFTDPVAQFAANKLFSSLSNDGELVIGNFSTYNPSRFVMEALGDWYLIYRNEESLKNLFGTVTPNIKIESEKEGINLFAVLKK